MTHQTQDNSRFKQFVDLIHTDDSLDGIDFVVHRLGSKETSDYPRFAWIWRGGNIARNPESSGPTIADGCAVKCPLVDNVTAEIHCWGETFEQAELMRNCMLGALDRRMGARFSVTGYVWWNEQETNAEYDVSGVKCIMTITAEILIGTEITETTTLAATATDVTFQDAPEGSTIEAHKTINVP